MPEMSDRQQNRISLETASVKNEFPVEDIFISTICYIPIVSALVLFLRNRNSEYVLFHAKQSLLIVLVSALGLMLLPFYLKTTLAIVTAGVLLYGAYQATRGKKWYFPVITELARDVEL